LRSSPLPTGAAYVAIALASLVVAAGVAPRALGTAIVVPVAIARAYPTSATSVLDAIERGG
jgi:hypothetical protein